MNLFCVFLEAAEGSGGTKCNYESRVGSVVSVCCCECDNYSSVRGFRSHDNTMLRLVSTFLRRNTRRVECNDARAKIHVSVTENEHG